MASDLEAMRERAAKRWHATFPLVEVRAEVALEQAADDADALLAEVERLREVEKAAREVWDRRCSCYTRYPDIFEVPVDSMDALRRALSVSAEPERP